MRLNEFTEQNVEEGQQGMSRAAKGHEKYGKAGMAALAKAGREGASDEQLDKIRDKHDKYAKTAKKEGVAEGEKKLHPKTWHDVDKKLGKAVDKMSQAEKVKKGLAHPDTLKKKGVAEGLNEMDKSAPQPGRDGRVSHSTYGSRDKKGSDYFKGKEAPGKAITAKQASKDALDILKKKGVAEADNKDAYQRDYDFSQQGFTRGARDTERHDLDVPRPTIYALKINGKIWQKDGNTVTFFTKERALAARNSILAKRPELEVGLVQRQD